MSTFSASCGNYLHIFEGVEVAENFPKKIVLQAKAPSNAITLPFCTLAPYILQLRRWFFPGGMFFR